MSIQAVAWAIETRVGDPLLKILLIAIANHASNKDWTCWPSQELLAYESEVSKRTIQRKLTELEQLGFISIENRRRADGTQSTSIIRLNSSGGQAVTLQSAGGQKGPSEGVTGGQKQGSPVDTKESTNNEPSRTVNKIEPSLSSSRSLGCVNGEAIEAELVSPKEQAESFFDKQFWPAYPKRYGSNPKEPAKKKIVAAILKGENPREILAGVNRLYAMLQRTGKIGTEYVPMALTWINRKSWKDDPIPAGNGKARGEMSFFDAAMAMESEDGTGTH